MSIRLATESDAKAIIAIYAPYVLGTTITFEIEVPSEDEMRRRLRNVLAAYPWLVCEMDGVVVGYAYASKYHPRAAYQWTVETSVYLAQEHHRRGIARALYTSLFALLRAQGVVNACAGIALPNPPSVTFHESMGFAPVRLTPHVGFKHGTWIDVGYWQLALVPLPVTPRELVPIANLEGTAAFHDALESGVSLLGPQKR